MTYLNQRELKAERQLSSKLASFFSKYKLNMQSLVKCCDVRNLPCGMAV